MIKEISKSGIAIISLSVAIIVLLMISGLVIYVSSDMATQAREIAFAKDIEMIYEKAQEYYAINGSLPVVIGGIQINADIYKSEITDSKFLAVLTEEIRANNDVSAMFYEVDMTKIGVKDSKYGLKEDVNDVYFISNTSQKVYYYPGVKIGKNIYFSNSSIVNK